MVGVSKYIILFTIFTSLNSQFCVENCDICENSTTCSICRDGYNLNRDGTKCEDRNDSNSTGVIVGVVVGGTIFIVILVILCFCCYRGSWCRRQVCGMDHDDEVYYIRPANQFGFQANNF